MTRLCVFGTEHETVLWGNWTESLASAKGEFDLVLSDLTLGNIPYEMRPEFYEAVTRSLARGGMLVDRVLTNEAGLKDPRKLDRLYERRPRNLRTANDFSSEYLFSSTLIKDVGDVRPGEMYSVLDARYKTRRILAAHAQDAHLVTPASGEWYYSKSWAEVSASYFPQLTTKLDLPEPQSSVYGGSARFRFLQRQSVK